MGAAGVTGIIFPPVSVTLQQTSDLLDRLHTSITAANTQVDRARARVEACQDLLHAVSLTRASHEPESPFDERPLCATRSLRVLRAG